MHQWVLNEHDRFFDNVFQLLPFGVINRKSKFVNP